MTDIGIFLRTTGGEDKPVLGRGRDFGREREDGS